jgi:hypothetical protein
MKILPTNNPKNWEEDYNSPDDNGCYQNRCIKCEELFLGHKYRKVCKLCSKEVESIMIPEILLDENGYPTDEWLDFIKDYKPEVMPIMDFLKLLERGWYLSNWGFRLHKKYKGIRKLELHTGGWSGNEITINVILDNIFLKWLHMKYYQWNVGGHYYFEITE